MAFNFSHLIKKSYTWTDLKTISLSKVLSLQYYQDSIKYIIYGYDGPEIHTTIIWIREVPYTIIGSYSQEQNDSDKADFEANFKNSKTNSRIALSSGITFVDRSGTTSVTPGTSTQIMPENLNRKYLFIQNIDDAVIWINFTSTATAGQSSIELLPGAAFVLEGSSISTEAVNVVSQSASIPYTAKEK